MSIRTEEKKMDNKCPVIKKEETQSLFCSNMSCKKELASLLHLPSDTFLYHLSVKCPFCGRQAYDFDVSGDLKYVPAKGVLFVNILEKNDRVIIETAKA